MPRVFKILIFICGGLLGLSTFAEGAVDIENKRISLAMGSEPPTLFSARTTDSESMFVLAHIMEGLLQFGEANQLLPGVAERWQMDDQGAVFYLRENARWRDGKPVTAHDFVFAWQTVLEASTAAPYAPLLYPIKNAEAIHNGTLPVSVLGVVAEGERVLRVNFEGPCPYFLNLMPFATFLPLRQDTFETHQRKYAAEPEYLMTNGPFRLSEWVHGASLRLDKSDSYWNSAEIKLNGIDVPYITADPSARVNLFRGEQIAFTNVSGDSYSQMAATGKKLYSFADGFLAYLAFNQRDGHLMQNQNLRKAVAALIDTRVLVNNILGSPANKPVYSQFPSIVKALDGALSDLAPPVKTEPNLKQAKAYLAAAKQELGGTIEPIGLLVSDTPTSIKIGEYIQFVLRQGLGLEVYIDKQTFKQRLARSGAGKFDIVLTNWGPDFDDALTYAELFASWNVNNRGRYKSAEYDSYLRILQRSVDPEQRFNAMRRLRDILRADTAIVPLYESGSIYVQHQRLKNLYRSAFGGDPILRFAEVE